MRVVFGADQKVGQWVAGQLGYANGFSGYFIGAIGVANDTNDLIGGTCFHNHYPNEGVIEMTSACVDSRWLSRRMIRAIFAYVFDLLECQLVVMRVGSDNSVMLNIAKRFGFNLYTIPRLRGKMADEVICTMSDDQWRSSPFNRSK